MAKTKKKPADSGNEIYESPEALAEQLTKAEQFLEDKKNRGLVLGVGTVIAVALAAFIGYRFYMTNLEEEAQTELFQAVYYFEADSLGKALNGDGNNYGFLDVIDQYGMTDAANMANFYAGATFLKLGDHESAIRYLKDFSASDLLVQAKAYSLIGDAYMDLEDYNEAYDYYGKAVSYKPNEQFTPLYLTKLAVAAEMKGDKQAAIQAYGRIVDEYKKSQEYQEARKHKARLEVSAE